MVLSFTVVLYFLDEWKYGVEVTSLLGEEVDECWLFGAFMEEGVFRGKLYFNKISS